MNAIDEPLVVIINSRPKLIMMMVEVVDDVINLHLQSLMKISIIAINVSFYSKNNERRCPKDKKNNFFFAIMNESESARLELH